MSTQKNKYYVRNLVIASLFLAMAFVLPFFTANDMQLGNMLCLMHIPILLCGFICGPIYGLGVGIIAPLLRSLILQRPPLMPTAVCMAVELAVYGLITGLMYKKLPKKTPYVYVSLVTAMLVGRLAWGAVKYAIMAFGTKAFTLSMFWTDGFVTAVPGIVVQLILIPAILAVYQKIMQKND